MEHLIQPFSDIVGAKSPVQQALKTIDNLFKKEPMPNAKSEDSKNASQLIIVHLLGLMHSAGMINASGKHSSAITMFRSIEDATDCFAAVSRSDAMAKRWMNKKLKASDAAKFWTDKKTINKDESLGEYRKTIRDSLNKYSHCSPDQTNWNLYLEKVDTGMVTRLNYGSMIITINGFYIDRYLCIHLYELIEIILENYSDYFKQNKHIQTALSDYQEQIEELITGFLKRIDDDKLEMGYPPEMKPMAKE